jgi:hypothetical protein
MINFVLQGQMDIRVANNIGYLCMGALMTIDSTERAERQARLDAERAANRAEDKAERKAAREAKQAEKAAQAEQQAAQKAAEEAAQKEKPTGWFFRTKYGEKRHISEVTTTLTTCGPNARTETYRAVPTGQEFVSSTRPDLVPLFPNDVDPEKTPEAWALCQKAKQAKAQTEAEAQAAQQPTPENLAANNFERTAPPESGEKKPEAQNEAAQKQAAENGADAPNPAERRLPFFLRKRRVIVTKRPVTEHESAHDGLNHG